MIVSTGATIENLAKLKFGRLAKQLFGFRQRQIDLLETELKATGRELAYIVKADERFRS